jgi:Protein of unknown function (DUF2283)
MAKRTLFSETTPLQELVVLTRDRWREIIRFKHPAVRGHEENVRECLRDPDFIREPETGDGLVEKVRVYFDRAGNTLSVWFGDPAKETHCEEIGDDTILVKDRRGRVIGFERLNYLSRKQKDTGTNVPVEVQML